jgi:hypothetical protein
VLAPAVGVCDPDWLTKAFALDVDAVLDEELAVLPAATVAGATVVVPPDAFPAATPLRFATLLVLTVETDETALPGPLAVIDDVGGALTELLLAEVVVAALFGVCLIMKPAAAPLTILALPELRALSELVALVACDVVSSPQPTSIAKAAHTQPTISSERIS